jgi:hypothetical protein
MLAAVFIQLVTELLVILGAFDGFHATVVQASQTAMFRVAILNGRN